MNARRGGVTAGRVALAAFLAVAGAVGCRPKTAGRQGGQPAPLVTVVCDAPGMDAEEVESQVTGPVETALFGTPGVERLRSVSRFGKSVLWIEVQRGTDVLEARQIVAERLTAARLPDAIERVLTQSWPGEVMLIGLHAPGAAEDPTASAVSLRDLADFEFRPRLERAPGLSQITVTGGLRRQYQVVASPDRLAAFDITMSELAGVLAGGHATPHGPAGQQGGEHLVRGAGGPRTMEDLADTVVATRNERPVRLRDVAEVRRIGRAAEHDGGEGPIEQRRDPVAQPAAVLLAVGLMPDADRQHASETIDRVLRQLNSELPIGIEIARKLPRRFDPLVGKMIEELRRELPPDVRLRRRPSERCGDLIAVASDAPFVAKLFGPDPAVLRSKADEVRRRMAEVPGVTDIEVEPEPDVPKLDFEIDRQKASLLGLTPAEVTETLDAAFHEPVVARLLAGTRTFDVVLKAVESRSDPTPINGLFVRASSGELVPVSQLATARVVLTPRAIYRENGERVMFISCRVNSGGDADADSAVEKALAPVVQSLRELEGGYRVEYDRQ